MRRGLAAVGLASLGLLLQARGARAAEETEIASAFDEGDPFDLFLGVTYGFESKRAAIKREFAGPLLGMPDGPTPEVRDLLFRQSRHVLTPYAAVGLFTDLQLSVALPIVLLDTRRFSFDQRAEPCIFPGDPQMRTPTCIDARNSTTFLDGLLPASSDQIGFDAEDPTENFPVDSTTVFRGPDRKGLDQIHLGLAWAPMNQARDDTKPTWLLGATFQLSVGEIMRFDRQAPENETGVSRGVHEVKVYTSLSKRTSWSEPYVTFFWKTPLGFRGTDPDDPDDSLFWDVGFGQEALWPQQEAGTVFGFEAIPYDDPVDRQRISLELRGWLTAHFEGRGYSEMWEIFAFAGDARAGGPLVLDRDPTMAGQQPLSHPGVTMIENYLTLGGRLGINARVGHAAKFSASFNVGWDQEHRISYTDAGEDSPDPDDVVSPGTTEVNPLHVPLIDVTGRRYLVDESLTYTFLVAGTILF